MRETASEMGRLFTVTWLSFRGSLRGLRLVALGAFALVPSAIVLAIASANPAPSVLSDAAEGLFTLLTLPVVVLLIVLVLSVSQFRSEIDAETLLYLSDRSIARSTIVVGKYLGSLSAAVVLVVPATVLPLGIAVLGGGSAYPIIVPLAMAAATLVAATAYGGFFLFLGLVTRSALLLGLLFGILWEELLTLLPGDAPRLTVTYYLRSFLSWTLSTGPLSGYPTDLPYAVVVIVPLGLGVAFVVLGGVVFRFLETAPERESA